MNPEKMAVAAIKTILENSKGNPSKSDWRAILDIVAVRIGMPVDARFKGSAYHTLKQKPVRDTDYHVRHGKLAKGKGKRV